MLSEATYYKLCCHRRSFNFLVLFAHLNISGAARGDLRRETHSKSSEIFAGLIARAPTAAAQPANWSSNPSPENERKAHTHNTRRQQMHSSIFWSLVYTHTTSCCDALLQSITFLWLEREPRPETDKSQILLVLITRATCFSSWTHLHHNIHISRAAEEPFLSFNYHSWHEFKRKIEGHFSLKLKFAFI